LVWTKVGQTVRERLTVLKEIYVHEHNVLNEEAYKLALLILISNLILEVS